MHGWSFLIACCPNVLYGPAICRRRLFFVRLLPPMSPISSVPDWFAVFKLITCAWPACSGRVKRDGAPSTFCFTGFSFPRWWPNSSPEPNSIWVRRVTLWCGSICWAHGSFLALCLRTLQRSGRLAALHNLCAFFVRAALLLPHRRSTRWNWWRSSTAKLLTQKGIKRGLYGGTKGHRNPIVHKSAFAMVREAIPGHETRAVPFKPIHLRSRSTP